MKSKISKTKIARRARKKTDPELSSLIFFLKKQKKPLWHNVAKYLARPKRISITVNIEKINKLTKDDDIIVVPGKILSKGNLDHKIMVAAFSFSGTAKQKLSKKAEILSIKELVEKLAQTKGVNVRIII